MQNYLNYILKAQESSIYAGAGQEYNEKKPKIAIFSSNAKSETLATVNAVKSGIISGGGLCEHFVVESPNTYLAYSKHLSTINEPAKNYILNQIENILTIYNFNGIVFIPSGESGIKAMMLSSVKINLPCLFVSNGASGVRFYKNNRISQDEIYTMTAKRALEQISDKELNEYIQNFLPASGEGEGIWISNSLLCVCEALGLSVKDNASACIGSLKRNKIALETGKAVLKLAGDEVTPKKLLNKASFVNAFTLALAIGGESEVINFVKDLAYLAGFDFSYQHISEIASKVPFICNIYPFNEKAYMEDLDNAGGVSAILYNLNKLSLVNEKAMNYLGESITDSVKNSKPQNNEIILSEETSKVKNNVFEVLTGNLAEKGAFVRRSGIHSGLSEFSGYAQVFEDEESACNSVYSGRVQRSSVIVIRNLGEKGAPGKHTINPIMAALKASDLINDVAVITDGKASSLFGGLIISEISPESFEGEMLALISDGDVIGIDLINRKINVKLTAKDVVARRKSYAPYIRHEILPTDKFFKKR